MATTRYNGFTATTRYAGVTAATRYAGFFPATRCTGNCPTTKHARLSTTAWGTGFSATTRHTGFYASTRRTGFYAGALGSMPQPGALGSMPQPGAPGLIQPGTAGVLENPEIQNLGSIGGLQTEMMAGNGTTMAMSQPPNGTIPNQSIETQTEAQMWRPALDPNTGKTYYYHQLTRQTQWTNPLESSMGTGIMPGTGDFGTGVDQLTSGRRRRRSMKEMQDAWDRGERAGLWECPDCGKILTEGSKKSHPESCSTRKLRNAQLARSQDVLAGAQWSSCADPNTGKTYYYHQMTKETTWEKPLAMINYEAHMRALSNIGPGMMADPSAMGAGMVGTGMPGMPGSMPGSGLGLTGMPNYMPGSTAGLYGGQNAIAGLPAGMDTSGQTSAVAGTELNANNAVAGMVPGVQNPLSVPGEWKEAVDSLSGKKYFYHSVTRQTSWTKPLEAPAAPAEVPPAAADSTKRKREDESTAEKAEIGEPAAKRIVPMWKVAFDPATGKNYYYHRETKLTSWDKPQELKDLEAAMLTMPPQPQQPLTSATAEVATAPATSET
eukprot:570492_1